MSKTRQRFAPHGALALEPKAFGQIFDVDRHDGFELTENNVAVLKIRGPLMHHRDFFFDSYEEIKERLAKAIAATPAFVLMSIDSPGGVVSGAFDTARALRAMAAAAGVDLYAHVEGQATSAAYALASAAMWIGVSESASIGSIGVLDTLVDQTGANALAGLNVQVVTSGARKADGNPNVEISGDTLAATQSRVDEFAGMFFDLVTEHGWGRGPGALRALEANVITGAQAVTLGLATEVATFEQSIAFATPAAVRGESSEAQAIDKGKYMASATEDEEALVASLRKMAEGDDEDMARKARAALKALGAEDEDEEPEAGDDEESTDEDMKAQDDEEEEEAKAASEASATASAADSEAMAMAAKAMAEIHEIKASRAKEKASAERSRLLASRPDFAPEFIKVLEKSPMATVRRMVKELPKGPARKDRVAASATATGTRGETQGDGVSARLPPDQKAKLDIAMGLTAMKAETVNTPHRLSFGVIRAESSQKGDGIK